MVRTTITGNTRTHTHTHLSILPFSSCNFHSLILFFPFSYITLSLQYYSVELCTTVFDHWWYAVQIPPVLNYSHITPALPLVSPQAPSFILSVFLTQLPLILSFTHLTASVLLISQCALLFPSLPLVTSSHRLFPLKIPWCILTLCVDWFTAVLPTGDLRLCSIHGCTYVNQISYLHALCIVCYM